MSEPFVYGQNTVFRVTQNGNPWSLHVKSWSISQAATEATDDVNGEKRSRHQTIVNGYACEFDPYTESGAQVLATLLANQDVRDEGLADQSLAGAIIFEYLNGTAQGFALKECTMGPFSVASTGRNAAVMNKLKFRARWFSKVAASPF